MRALVSIIIPVYNIEEYLPRCLESVAKQTYHNLEIILVDDGSTDGSWSICQSFEKKDNRFKTIRQDNGGPYIARNTGLRVAHGDYILFVDGDDYIHVDTVRIMLESINQNCGYDMAMVDYKKTIRLDENVEEILENVTTELAQDELMNNMFIKSSEYNVALYHCLWNKLFRRELVDGIWFYGDPRFEDFEFCFRVFLKVRELYGFTVYYIFMFNVLIL